MSPLLAQSGHEHGAERCPLSGVKRTLAGGAGGRSESVWLERLDRHVDRRLPPLDQDAKAVIRPLAMVFYGSLMTKARRFGRS